MSPGDDELGRSDRRLRAILDALPVGVFILDEHGRPWYANGHAVELLGRGVDPNADVTSLAERYDAFVEGTNELYPTERMPVARALAGERAYVDDIVVRRPDRDVPLEVWGAPVGDDTDGTACAVSVFSDVTDRKRAQAEVERSNADLQQFAYVASHDLSEPLRAIAGFVQLLARRYEGQLDDDADRYIRHTVEATERMRMLIDDLLLYSRVGRRRAFGPVDLAHVMDDVRRDLRTTVDATGAEITVGPLPVVSGEITELRQLLQNAVSNGLKFRTSDAAPHVDVRAVSDGPWWRVTVADNGIGIEPQYRERVFRMFQRLHTRDLYPGTGIGLALCEKIVTHHGGRIWIDDNPGGGTRLCFTLPTADAVAA